MWDTKQEASMIGRRIGTYEIQSLVGRGGMGAVYRARDLSLQRDVALKILRMGVAEDPAFEQRFIREARTVAQMDHPGIVQIYAAGRSGDLLFIAMPFLTGKTMDTLIRERGVLPWREVLLIARSVAQALAYAHKQGIIHRDIKPSNLMIDEPLRVKVMDFGIARSIHQQKGITRSDLFVGTPEYCSPEQFETDDLDGRTDIYSLGVAVYEALTGRLPFTAETPIALYKRITNETPIPIRLLNPKVPRSVETLVQRMMERDRNQRIPSAEDLVREIDRALRGATDSVRRFLPVRAGRRPALALASLAFVFLGVGALWLALRPGEPIPPGSAAGDPVPKEIRAVVGDVRNLTGNPNYDWIRVCLSDQLADLLDTLPSMKVPARNEVLRRIQKLEPSATEVTDRHRELLIDTFQSDLLLTGSYLVEGKRILVTVRAYKGAELRELFTLKFTGEVDKPISLVDRMVKEIVDAIRSRSREAFAVAVAPADALPTRSLIAARSSRLGFARPSPPPVPSAPAAEVQEIESDRAKVLNRKAAPPDGILPAIGPAAGKRELLRKGENDAYGSAGGRRRGEWGERPPAPGGLVEKLDGTANLKEELTDESFIEHYRIQALLEQLPEDQRMEQAALLSCRVREKMAPVLEQLNENLQKLQRRIRLRSACESCGPESDCQGCPGKTTWTLVDSEPAKEK